MILSLNFVICFCALFAAITMNRMGYFFRDCARFMFFIAAASFFSGLAETFDVHSLEFSQLIASVNTYLPSYVSPFNWQMIIARLWFVVMLCIGTAEFYFMFIFIGALIHKKYVFIKTWLRFALISYFLLMMISTQFLFMVMFHMLSHSIIIAFSLFIFYRWRIPQILYLAQAAAYNVGLGVMQQLMAHGVIACGPLHYNDWYHLGVLGFVIVFYYLFTNGGLIESLHKV
jgi:hypothetical protein